MLLSPCLVRTVCTSCSFYIFSYNHCVINFKMYKSQNIYSVSDTIGFYKNNILITYSSSSVQLQYAELLLKNQSMDVMRLTLPQWELPNISHASWSPFVTFAPTTRVWSSTVVPIGGWQWWISIQHHHELLVCFYICYSVYVGDFPSLFLTCFILL